MKITFHRARKLSADYCSVDVGLEIVAECDDELYYDRPADFAKWAATQYAALDQAVEAEAVRLHAAKLKPAEPAREREHVAAANGNGHNGDREIERARDRDEPRYGFRNGDGASTKQRFDWNRNGNGSNPDDRREDRGGRKDYRRGGGFGPPRTGSQLFAWAKGHEERGADGFVKALQKCCKDMTGAWKFNDLRSDDVQSVFEAGERMLEDQGGY